MRLVFPSEKSFLIFLFDTQETSEAGGAILPSFTPAPETAPAAVAASAGHINGPSSKGPDPYLLSDAELAGKDFSGPYFYPRDRKIIKKARKE
jgi:hypothetical protein